MKRIILFIITNFSIMLIIGLVLSIVGINSHNILQLLILAGFTGFGGSLISLFLSKKLALKSVAGTVITKPNDEDQKWLIETISKQAKKMRITMPEVVIYPATDLNAFTTGPNHNNSLIAVSTSLLKNMTKDEVEAVLAHEMSHIYNGDMVTMTLLQGIANTFVFFISHLLTQLFYSLNPNSNTNSSISNYVTSFVISILQTVIGLFATIIIMWFSRKREFYADAGSAKLVGSDKMIAALQRLESTIAQPSQEIISPLKPFCINGESKKHAFLMGIFMSHPSIQQRIKALRSLKYLK
ncbi:MAG: protease HtpX [Candidatus Dasytiphilus stammeri]